MSILTSNLILQICPIGTPSSKLIVNKQMEN